MHSICVISVYFGKLPDHIDLWMLSCKYNPSIDFLMVTDQLPHNTPANLKVINMTLDQFSSLAGKQLDMDLSIKEPYKCCDFKPVYGIILQDEIKSYDFWGHCDLDLIFGDLRAFLKEEILKIYDKIYNLGHLSIYRNTAECNDRYKEQGSSIGSYRDVFLSDKNYAFDELNGMYRIYLHNHFPIYDKRDFADISVIYKRFRLALKDRNYNHQVFYWENGKVFRVYVDKENALKTEEFTYIHFKKRVMKMSPKLSELEALDCFYISRNGFYEKKAGIPEKEEIKKMNPYHGFVFERVEKVCFFGCLYFRIIYDKLKSIYKRKHI